MIKEFIDEWNKRKSKLRSKYEKKLPTNYSTIVKDVVELLSETDSYHIPDPNNIEEIDHGHYQGTLVYIIPEEGYQPSQYYYVKVYYGSCSGCDTLLSIIGYGDDEPTKQQVDDIMQLALHILQGLKKME